MALFSSAFIDVASDCTSCETKDCRGRGGLPRSGDADRLIIWNCGNGYVVDVFLQRSVSHGYSLRIGTARIGTARIGTAPPDGSMNRLAGSALESNVSRDLLWVANQSDIFDQQADHPFPIPVRSFWILPDFRKIIGQSKDLLPGLRRYGLSG